jgi:hypothetical protein
MGLSDFTLQSIGFRVLTLLIVAAIHGATVAAAAVLLGDRGPKHDGRLTLSPATHVDLVGAFCLVLFGLGWTKSVDVAPRDLRVGPAGIVLVILAGAAALLAAAAVLDALVVPALTTLPHSAALATAAFLREAASLSIWIALLSLAPLPPLTGGLLLPALGLRLPRQVTWGLTALLVIAVATGFARQALAPAHALVSTLVLGT